MKWEVEGDMRFERKPKRRWMGKWDG